MQVRGSEGLFLTLGRRCPKCHKAGPWCCRGPDWLQPLDLRLLQGYVGGRARGVLGLTGSRSLHLSRVVHEPIRSFGLTFSQLKHECVSFRPLQCVADGSWNDPLATAFSLIRTHWSLVCRFCLLQNHRCGLSAVVAGGSQN